MAAIAKRYAGDPAILGYDILNEPIAPYHDVATLNPRLEPFYKEGDRRRSARSIPAAS